MSLSRRVPAPRSRGAIGGAPAEALLEVGVVVCTHAASPSQRPASAQPAPSAPPQRARAAPSAPVPARPTWASASRRLPCNLPPPASLATIDLHHWPDGPPSPPRPPRIYRRPRYRMIPVQASYGTKRMTINVCLPAWKPEVLRTHRARLLVRSDAYVAQHSRDGQRFLIFMACLACRKRESRSS